MHAHSVQWPVTVTRGFFSPGSCSGISKGSVGKPRVSLRQEVSNCEAYIRHILSLKDCLIIMQIENVITICILLKCK